MGPELIDIEFYKTTCSFMLSMAIDHASRNARRDHLAVVLYVRDQLFGAKKLLYTLEGQWLLYVSARLLGESTVSTYMRCAAMTDSAVLRWFGEAIYPINLDIAQSS